MREHNKNAEPDLTNVAHEEIVDKGFYSATPRSVTDIMAVLSKNMSFQALARKNYHCFKLLSMKEILLRKLLESKVKICNGKSFIKRESSNLLTGFYMNTVLA